MGVLAFVRNQEIKMVQRWACRVNWMNCKCSLLRTYYNAGSAYSWKTHSVVGVKKCNVKKSESLSGFHSPFFPIIDLSPFLALPLVPPTEQKCCGLFLQYFLSIFFGLLSIKTSFQNVRNLLGMVSLLQRWIIVVWAVF
jgi:hypothetical protein